MENPMSLQHWLEIVFCRKYDFPMYGAIETMYISCFFVFESPEMKAEYTFFIFDKIASFE